jgi:thiol-disulfide isomerase/thioredoxin
VSHPARPRRGAMWLPSGSPFWACLAAVRLRCSRACAPSAAALAVAVALLAAGCGSGSSAPGTLGPGTTVFKAGTGPLVPAITGPLVGGGKLSLASYRGHVVVLNFWGSWCSICHEEAPSLAAAARRLQSSGVRFLGVDVADNPASALAYMRHFRIAYPSLNDPGDKIALDFHNAIPIAAFPSTLIISPDGRVAARIIGAVTYQGLTRVIKEAAARPR